MKINLLLLVAVAALAISAGAQTTGNGNFYHIFDGTTEATIRARALDEGLYQAFPPGLVRGLKTVDGVQFVAQDQDGATNDTVTLEIRKDDGAGLRPLSDRSGLPLMASTSRAAPRRGTVPLVVPMVLICATATSILSTDLFTPSLPHLPAYFASDADTVQLTMSINLMGFALAQLIFGPLSDRFGRRPVLLLGMFGFLVFTLAASTACLFLSLMASLPARAVLHTLSPRDFHLYWLG